jgi:hypothetical protein
VLTRDNLAKRRTLNDASCLFCSEAESAEHLFFSCCVAVCVWNRVADVLNVGMVRDSESLARWRVLTGNETNGEGVSGRGPFHGASVFEPDERLL